MEKLDTESETKFINALVKSVQSLCHGYLDFHSGVEIIGHINLSVDKGSSLHYILEEKVCKNEENSTLFISNSFHAQNQKHEGQPTTEDSQKEPSENQDIDKTDYKVLIKAGNASSSVSTYSPTLSGRNETSETESSSGTKEPDSVPSRSVSTVSGCPKRKAPGDQTNARNTKSSRVCSLPCPVSRISSRCPREPAESDVLGRVDLKQSQSEVHPPCENVTGTVVPQGTGAAENTESSLDISLAGSVLERVDSQDSPDLNSRTDDSDGDGEVMFIKQEFVEGESPLCQFQGTGGEQSYGRGEHQTQGASSSDALSDASPYSVSLQHPAAATYVPGSHEEDASTTSAAAQLYGPSTLSLSQPGSSVSRGWHGAPDFNSLPWQSNVYEDAASTSEEGVNLPSRQPQNAGHVTAVDKPYQCQLCHRKYSHIKSLKLHVRQYHMDNPTFRCEICGAGYMNSRGLNNHMNCHSNIKTYKCQVCSKVFAYRPAFLQHQNQCKLP